MTADTSTKFYHNTMMGAPIINGASQGELVAALDACLVYGFNTTTPTSLTFSGGIATLTFASTPGYIQDQVIRVSGANDSIFNGDWRVSSIGQYTVSFLMEGSPPASTTGNISVKTPPLDMEILFTGINKRVYRSTNILSAKNLLRVDDSLDPVYNAAYAKKAKITMVQAGGMYDIDTFVPSSTRAPYDNTNTSTMTKNEIGTGSGTAAADGWYKWYYAKYLSPTASSYSDSSTPITTGPRTYSIVGTDRGFYLMLGQGPNASDYLSFYMFIDIVSYRPGDTFATVLSATDLYNTAGSGYVGLPSTNCSSAVTYDSTGKTILRSYTQIGGYTGWTIAHTNYTNAQQVSGNYAAVPFPYNDDTPLLLDTMYVREYPSTHLRGHLPGIKFIPHYIWHSHGTVIPTTNERYLICSLGAGNGVIGKIAFNLTTPWY